MAARNSRKRGAEELEFDGDDEPQSQSKPESPKRRKKEANGYIEQIEVENFKSYQGHQVIGPFMRFQAIIGPNGAGKSNLMDAISFVVGLNAAKLRGSQIRDLLYKSDKTGVSAKKGMVKLVYKTDAGLTREFQRTISEKGSDFKLDGKTVNLEEYNEALKDIHILVKARNFLVFQGDVEQIAQKSPKDLSALLETISGSGELKEEYDKAKTEKTRIDELTVQNFQRKKGITAERKTIRDQKEEAEKFVRLQAELDEAQVIEALYKINYHSKQITKLEGEIKKQEGARGKVNRDKEAADKVVVERKKDQGKALKARQQQSSAIEKAQKALDKKVNERAGVQDEIKHSQKRIKEGKINISRMQAELDKQTDEIERLEGDLAAATSELDKYLRQLQNQGDQGTLELRENQMRDYNKLKQTVASKTGALEAELERLRRAQKTDENALAANNAAKAENNDRRAALQAKIDTERERLAKMEKYVAETKENKKNKEKELHQVQDETKRLTQRTTEITQRQGVLKQKINEANLDNNESEKEARMKHTIENMKRAFPGVHGVFSEMVTPTSGKYRVAVAIAMGRNADAIVVDTDRTATECIQYLREQRAGVLTFIPLESIRVKPINDRLRMLGGSIKLIIDLLTFDTQWRRAVEYVCGNTLYCDQLDEARELCFGGSERYKVVTADGTLINKAGLMTGGPSGAAVKAKKFDSAEVEKSKKELSQLTKDLAELNKSQHKAAREEALQSEITGLAQRLQFSTAELRSCEEKIKDLDKELKSLEKELTKLDPAEKKLNDAIAGRRPTIESTERKHNKIEDEVFRDFAREVGVESIREYEEGSLKRATEQSARRLTLTSQKEKLQNQLEYARSHHLAEPLQAATASLEAEEEKLKRKQQEEKRKDKELETEEAALGELKEREAEAQQEVDKADERLKEARAQLEAVAAKALALEKEITSIETDMSNLRHDRHDVLQKCVVESIKLPKRGGGIFGNDDLPESYSQAGTEAQSQVSQSTLTYEAEDKIKLDFELVKDIDAPADEAAFEKMAAELAANVKEIVANIERMEPNMKAADKLDEVQNRLDDTEAEFNENRRLAKEATEAFEEVRKRRHDLFMAAFTQISSKINNIYKELTKSESYTNGGQAYLSLENSEEPFMHGVKYDTMPPAKRYRAMEQLSGGEKTVAALALLFAIHEFHPSPFFVLDEIDAALDATNVKRVAQYIASQSRRFQCIVISLKDQFFEQCESLVGIYKDHDVPSSKTLSLNLNEYDADE